METSLVISAIGVQDQLIDGAALAGSGRFLVAETKATHESGNSAQAKIAGAELAGGS